VSMSAMAWFRQLRYVDPSPVMPLLRQIRVNCERRFWTMARFRLVGYVVLNSLVALFGPVVLSSSLPPFHPHTGLGIIQKAWITSTVFAGFLGVVAVRAARLHAAKTAEWAWVIPAVIFSWRPMEFFHHSSGLLIDFPGHAICRPRIMGSSGRTEGGVRSQVSDRTAGTI
jgi:hypothetical protein